jgi:ATP synthase protein I
MAEDPQQHGRLQSDDSFAGRVGAKAARKLHARRAGPPGVWFGLGMMGLVGWSVAIPTLLGVAAGMWLDDRYGGPRSWTLALLMAGLAIGCLNAWHWVAREGEAMQDPMQDRRQDQGRDGTHEGRRDGTHDERRDERLDERRPGDG